VGGKLARSQPRFGQEIAWIYRQPQPALTLFLPICYTSRGTANGYSPTLSLRPAARRGLLSSGVRSQRSEIRPVWPLTS